MGRITYKHGSNYIQTWGANYIQTWGAKTTDIHLFSFLYVIGYVCTQNQDDYGRKKESTHGEKGETEYGKGSPYLNRDLCVRAHKMENESTSLQAAYDGLPGHFIGKRTTPYIPGICVPTRKGIHVPGAGKDKRKI